MVLDLSAPFSPREEGSLQERTRNSPHPVLMGSLSNMTK